MPRIAFVTGASRGIGKAIALSLAKQGIYVAVNARNLESIKGTAMQIENLGQKAMAIQGDVSKFESVQEMVAKIIAKLGGIDILVNNAGIGISKLWENSVNTDWENVLSVNLGSVFNCSKLVIETMKKRGGGCIINIASMAGKTISDMASPDYTATKAGIIGFTRQLAFELGPYDIRVNAVCPGTVKTSLTEITPEIEEKLTKLTPLRRLAKPEQIADAVSFLISEKAEMITGSTIDVDGGQRLSFIDWETYVKFRVPTY